MDARKDPILHWNRVALDVHREDGHQFDRGPADRAAGGQSGAVRASRAFAMVHLAMYDAWRAFHPAIGAPYLSGVARPARGISAAASVGGAAFGVLAGLYPRAAAMLHERQRSWTRMLLADGMPAIALNGGRAYGAGIAAAMLDPFTPKQGYLDSRWALEAATPGDAGEADRPVPARAATCTFGGRKAKELDMAPWLYNHCLHEIVVNRGLSTDDAALLLAAANLAMADAGIAAWTCRYQRTADAAFATAARVGRSFGAWPSGYATQGAACFGTVAAFLSGRLGGADAPGSIAFDLGTDEPDGAAGRTGGGHLRRHVNLAISRAANDDRGSRLYVGIPELVAMRAEPARPDAHSA